MRNPFKRKKEEKSIDPKTQKQLEEKKLRDFERRQYNTLVETIERTWRDLYDNKPWFASEILKEYLEEQNLDKHFNYVDHQNTHYEREILFFKAFMVHRTKNLIALLKHGRKPLYQSITEKHQLIPSFELFKYEFEISIKNTDRNFKILENHGFICKIFELDSTKQEIKEYFSDKFITILHKGFEKVFVNTLKAFIDKVEEGEEE